MVNFAANFKNKILQLIIMKKFFVVSLLLISSLLTFNSCEFDNSPEPDYPTYATYSISAGYTQYSGPEQLLTDIMEWVKANEDIYDTSAHYSTGAASEFTRQDAEAIQKYNDFANKFKAYLTEVGNKIAKGDYGPNVQVNGQFYSYVSRAQGEGGTLKTDSMSLIYPVTQ